MQVLRHSPPVLLLVAALCLVHGGSTSQGFTLLGFDLDLNQRSFRVFNNFSDATANDNQAPSANFPGYGGATRAIWKASVEWSSTLHGDGSGDPHQPGDLGSGGANFDVTFQGEANGVGGVNDNIHSAISGAPGGVIAYTEGGGAGWRIRYNDAYPWDDGPDAVIPAPQLDLQGIATRQYGFALGLGHSSVSGSTMAAAVSPADSYVGLRSIEADDQAGVQAIYGVAGAAKPIVNGVLASSFQLTITGEHFAPTGNEVWFTGASGGSSAPITVGNLVSNGTSLHLNLPPGAGSGDVLVRAGGMAGSNLSNPWPLDLSAICPAPTNYCTGAPNSVGAGTSISGTGSTSVAVANLQLHAQGCPPNKPGLFYYGAAQANQPFGEGVRCVSSGGAGIFRLPVLQTDSGGAAAHSIDFVGSPAGMGPGQLLAGGRWYFQFWYRDPSGGPVGFNLSDGLDVSFCP